MNTLARLLPLGWLVACAPLVSGTAVPGEGIVVAVDGRVDAEVLGALSRHGRVHAVVDRFGLVSVTPFPGHRDAIARLRDVRGVEDDLLGTETSLGTWNLDLLGVTDVEETSSPIAPPPWDDDDAREVAFTGEGVHVAMFERGLSWDWADFLPVEQIDADLARMFFGGESDYVQGTPLGPGPDEPGLWQKDNRGHGVGTTAVVTGFRVGDRWVDGVAPDAHIIPVGVKSLCTFAVVQGFAYLLDLREAGTVGPVVVNMSIGWVEPRAALEEAIEEATANGIVVVAAAGNAGEAGMVWPAAFPVVISAGGLGWTEQFQPVVPVETSPGVSWEQIAWSPDYWWTQDVAEPATLDEMYVTWFSSRAHLDEGQELDVLAPAAGIAGPWIGANGLFLFPAYDDDIALSIGTSLASPHVAGVAALMLEADPTLEQGEIEALLRATARPVPAEGSRSGVIGPSPGIQPPTVSWDADCAGVPCDAVGWGAVRAAEALAAVGP